MKKILVALAFAGITGSTKHTDNAKISATVTVSDNNPQKVTVNVSNPADDALFLSVSDAEHGTLYIKEISSKDFKTVLDFTTPIDGEYAIEITCKKGERVRKTVTMKSEQVVTRVAVVN